jgi:predicted nucleic acid-binding Zn ribbon protein
MYCTNCGKEIKNDSEFCPHCGVKLKSSRPREQKNIPIMIIQIITALILFIFGVYWMFSGCGF